MKSYWSCFIGPVEADKIPSGGDFPFRMVVKNAYYNLFQESADICSSGWGIDQEFFDLVQDLYILKTINKEGFKTISLETEKLMNH